MRLRIGDHEGLKTYIVNRLPAMISDSPEVYLWRVTLAERTRLYSDGYLLLFVQSFVTKTSSTTHLLLGPDASMTEEIFE